MSRDSRVETEGLVAGIRLAEQNMQKKSFRGSSGGVKIKLGGDLQPDSVEIDHKELGISAKDAKRIEEAVLESLRRATTNAQRGAEKLLRDELS